MTLVATTLGFCNWRTWANGLARLYPAHLAGWRHVFVDCHYPLDRERNLPVAATLAAALGIGWLDVGGDHGAAGNWNRALPHLGAFDFVATVDPDTWVDGPPDTLARCAELLRASPDLAWVSLEVPCTREDVERGHLRGGEPQTCPASGLEVYRVRPGVVGMIDLSVWRGDFLRAAGGFRQEYRWYGQVEAPMMRAAHERGLTYAYVLSARCGTDRTLCDPEYAAWKAGHLAGDGRGFGEWLKARAA